jgi:hypothetical protein
MIRQAKTPEQKEKCWNWFREKNYIPCTDLYLYIEKDDKIIACAGLIMGVGDTSKVGYIDTLLSEDLRASDILYNQCEGFLRALGANYIVCTSNVEKVWNILERLEYKLWIDNSKSFIKEL